MKHYIIVEVRESDPGANQSVAGRLRKVIHRAAAEQGRDVADIIVRGDKATDYFGFPTRWAEVHELFTAKLNSAKAIRAARTTPSAS